jgi:hypothetical protein
VIIWAASRAPLPREARVISDVTRTMGAKIVTIAMASLGREIVASLVQGPVVVVVSSRKDASSALSLGADEIVRVAQSVTLRKSTIESAIARAFARSGSRVASTPPPAAEICPALGILLRAVEARPRSSLGTAATICAEFASELGRIVAIADGLVQRVQPGLKRDELKVWFSEVKHYAQATLRLEALAAALREEVQGNEAALRCLGHLTVDFAARDTDVAALLECVADFVQTDLPPNVACEFVREAPCIVGVPCGTLISLTCQAIAIGLENIAIGGGGGRVKLRTSVAEGEVAIEVADDGAPGATDLRLTVLDMVFSNDRTARLRALREQVRRAGGELFVDSDAAGNVISIYLPPVSAQALVPAQRPSPLLQESNH